MKNIVTAIVASIILASTANAQTSDSLKINAGIVIAPQGGISLSGSSKGFQAFIPVLAVVSLTKKNTTFVPMYNVANNTAGILIAQDFTPKFGGYVIAMKSVLAKGGYTGVALTTPVANGRANGFVEVGTSWASFSPSIYVGVIIPFKFKVK
jgi:hypothetical protein